MAKRDGPTVIKKYANRRLYHTGTSTYVTLEDLARMVKEGEDFKVQDAKTGEDITRSVLAQIIFEQESKGQNLLPIAFLRQLIQFYGDSLQAVVPSYLEASLASFANNSDLRKQMNSALEGNPFDLVEDQVRRNMDLFSQAMRMWMPFGTAAGTAAGAAVMPRPTETEERPEKGSELDALRQQVSQLQEAIDTLAKRK